MKSIFTIVENIRKASITPFEKEEIISVSTSSELKEAYLRFWKKMICKSDTDIAFEKYLQSLEIDDGKINKMLFGEVPNCQEASSWPKYLYSVLSTIHDGCINIEYETEIPFQHFFQPFIKPFKLLIEEKIVSPYPNLIDANIIQRLEETLTRKLYDISQLVLIEEFGKFEEIVDSKKEEIANPKYQTFVLYHVFNRYETLFTKYPMLARKLSTTCQQFSSFIISLLNRVQNDYDEIQYKFQKQLGKLKRIELDIGDQHNGECTAILNFEKEIKVVYKPGSSKTTIAYNKFITWINSNLDENLKTFEVINKEEYAWLEFIEYRACKDESELHTYFKRAGILLGVVYFLNGRDFHYENVIAHGNCPVLIDHETIINPKVLPIDGKKGLRNTWEKFEGTILQSFLLPILEEELPPYTSGYGSSSMQKLYHYASKIAKVNTDQMKRVACINSIEVNKKNKPSLNGKFKTVSDYKAYFSEGFKSFYNLIINNKNYLLGNHSFLNLFEDIEIRFVWRATNVYHQILKNLNKPEYLCDATKYGLRLELIARAYAGTAEYLPLLRSERKQMLEGNIPIYKMNTLSEYLEVDNQMVRAFECNSMDALRGKIRKAAQDDCNTQYDLAEKSFIL